MNTAEPLTEEVALWASINDMPGDQLRRLVLADWYEERGQEDTAAALRATADRVPYTSTPTSGLRIGISYWSWICDNTGKTDTVSPDIMDKLGHGNFVGGYDNWRDYLTAAYAIRDLCRAWVRVHRGRGPRETDHQRV